MPILGALTPCAASHHRHTLSSLQPRTCPTSPQRPATTSATSTLRLLSITLSGHHGGTWTHLPRAPQAIQELRPGVVIAHAVVPRSCQSAVARPLLQTQHRLRSRFAAPQPADAGALVKGWTTDALRLRRRSQPSFKTDKVAGDNKEVSKWIDKYLGVGEWVMDQSVAIAGSSGFFERTR
ncbi:hypothetical protein ACCO45_008526 [Purpureocillium lilacinum]|uniref:Uncharacterized protein n=1 Tax=Purpureocillium lilacinum TaxID=33203 RepID=A0ACC4DPL7_PURLI